MDLIKIVKAKNDGSPPLLFLTSDDKESQSDCRPLLLLAKRRGQLSCPFPCKGSTHKE